MSEVETAELVVTVTATVMDGQVVRWYRSVAAAESSEEIMSVSRNGVMVRTYLHEIPKDLLALAEQAHRELAKGGDLRRLATHRRSRGFAGPYLRMEPVAAALACPCTSNVDPECPEHGDQPRRRSTDR